MIYYDLLFVTIYDLLRFSMIYYDYYFICDYFMIIIYYYYYSYFIIIINKLNQNPEMKFSANYQI